MIITSSNKSFLRCHLTDLCNTISSCIRFGVKYSRPGYFNVADLQLQIGDKTVSVSSFETLLLSVQILLQKCDNNDFKQNPLLFEQSISQIEAIISNSFTEY